MYFPNCPVTRLTISSGSALFAKTKIILREYNTTFFGKNCDSSIYAMDPPDFIVCSFMEMSIGLKGKQQSDLLMQTEFFLCLLYTFVSCIHT